MRRALAAAAVALLLAGAAAAAPAKGPVFGLRAVGNAKLGYFVYTLAPGATRQGAVVVSNVGSAAGTVQLFTADATTGPTSGTVYKTDAAPTQAGKWVTLAATSFALRPGAHRRVPFTVRAPAGAKPGQWVGGIVAETSHQVASQKPGQKARVQIKVRDLTIVAVQVNVPGPPVVSFTIGRVTTGGQRGFQKVIIHLESTSNVLAKPQGVVRIYDRSGKLVESLDFTMDTFLPHTAIDYPLLLKKALPAGDYHAVVQLHVPGVAGAAAKSFAARPTFSVSNADVKQVFTSAAPQAAPPVAGSSGGVPTWTYAAAAGAAVLLLLLLLLLRRRRSAAQRRRPTTTLQRSSSASPVEPAAEPAVAAPPPPPPPWQEPVPEPAPAASASAAPCDEHDWDVAYSRGELGADGVWRFPHRCRTCALELLARDVADATAQADAQRL